MKVFVYGTLKRGNGNHSLLANAEFVGNGTTVKSFRMGDSGFPVLLESKNGRDGCARVQGEVYEVDEATLQLLDHLEAEGRMYRREVVKVDIDDKIVKCFAYVGIGKVWKGQLDLIAPKADNHHHWSRG